MNEETKTARPIDLLLSLASSSGDLQKVKSYIKNGADISFSNFDAFSLAISGERESVVSFFISTQPIPKEIISDNLQWAIENKKMRSALSIMSYLSQSA